MQKKPEFPSGFSMEQAMQLAGTTQGQALLNQLQQQHGKALESAIAQAQSGNYAQVQKTLQDYLKTPEGKALLQQLKGGSHG